MTRRRWLGGALAAAALLLVLGRLLAAWYVEQQWYAALDASVVWRARVNAVATLRVGSALIAAGFVFLNLYAVRQSVVSLVLPRRVGNLDIGEEVPGGALLAVAAVLSALLGGLLSLSGDHWITFLLANDGRSFGETDPYFQSDLGFYIARLPFETVVYEWSLLLLGATSAAVVLLYALTPSLRLNRAGLYVSAYVRRHLTILGGVLLLLLAWSYRLDLYGLLLNGTGPGGAFSWSDHKVGMPGLLLLAIVTLAIALVVMWAGWIGQTRLAFLALTGVVLLSLLVRHVAPVIAARAGDEENAAQRERPYQATRTAYTRRAFGLDGIVLADSMIGFASAAELAGGTSLWDSGALVAALDQREAPAGDELMIGWRQEAGGLVAVVPEPVPTPIGVPGSRWRLPRVMVTRAHADGRPQPAAPATQGGRAGSPTVYPGAAPYAVLADSSGRILGASLGALTARVAHAWALQNPALADGGELPLVRPTLVRRRDVRARVEALVPFFTQGAISPAIAGDTLFWIVHLYATSRHYPMAERLDVAGHQVSYIRPAAVAIVHGASGRVWLVPAREPDPLGRGWIERFAPLFRMDTRELPAAVIAAIPPHEELFFAQAQTLGRHGSRAMRPGTRRVPLLDPHLLGADEPLAGRLPPIAIGGGTMLVVPVLDEGERMTGVLIATGGPRRRTMWRPMRTGGPGEHGAPWEQVLDRLRTAASGDGLLRGAVRAVPTRGGLVFIQSRYRAREDGSPSLAGVAMLQGDSVRSGRSLEALAGVVPIPGTPAAAATTGSPEMARLWERMRDALARGDWTTFGSAFDSLGTLLGRTPR